MSGQRIWRTADGRHVADGDLDAAFLAYAEGDEVPANVLAEVDGKPTPKARRKPADKAMPKSADKAMPKSADKGGLTVTRLRDAGDDEG